MEVRINTVFAMLGAILIAAMALGSVLFGTMAFITGKELRAAQIALTEVRARTETTDRALLQCEARREQFEELLGLAAWRKKQPEGVGGN